MFFKALHDLLTSPILSPIILPLAHPCSSDCSYHACAPTFYSFIFTHSSIWNALPPSNHVAHSSTFFRTLLECRLERISIVLYFGHVHGHPVYPPSPTTSTPGTPIPHPALLTLFLFCISTCYIFTCLYWLSSVLSLPTLECKIYKSKDIVCFVTAIHATFTPEQSVCVC